jgi:phosphocarrier protein HPr
MIIKTYKVIFTNGLHARPAAELVRLLKPFNSDVYLLKDEKRFNLKSIIHIMSTSIKEGDAIQVEITGEDEANVEGKLDVFFGE